MAKTKTRTRNWTFLVYTENAGAWGLIHPRAVRLGVKMASCCHAFDTLEDGSHKKTHIHVVVAYEGVKSLEQVKEDWGDIAANGVVEPVRNLTAALRYLRHQDNPEKYQYKELDDCIGFLPSQFEKKEKTDDIVLFNQIIDWINAEDCISMAYLIDYARHERQEWLTLLLKQTYCTLILSYIRSSYWSTHTI